MKMGPNGQLYITGSTHNSEMPYIDGAYDNFNDGLTDIFLAIIDTTANGNFTLKYFSYYGGSNNDTPRPWKWIAGVAYIAGYTTSIDFPMAGNSVRPPDPPPSPTASSPPSTPASTAAFPSLTPLTSPEPTV